MHRAQSVIGGIIGAAIFFSSVLPVNAWQIPPASQRHLTATAVAATAGSAAADTLAAMSGPKPTNSAEFIVQYHESTKADERAALKTAHGLKGRRQLRMLQAELVEADSPEAAAAAMRRLANDPRVRLVQPSFRYEPSSNDTYFSSLWGLENTGQTVLGVAGIPDVDIDIADAWPLTRGSRDIVVAVIDTGIDTIHPDLSGNIWTNPGETAGDGIDNDRNGYVDDIHGWNFYGGNNTLYSAGDKDQHGTHVAGTIAAAADNAKGIAGVAPNVRIMPLKVIGPSSGSTDDAVDAIAYAQAMGADLISASWGGPDFDALLHQAIQNYGKPFIAAAGNKTWNLETTPEYPAAFDCDNIVSVAAVDSRGQVCGFSNYGATRVDVGAPGQAILSTLPNSAYGWMDGTSMATPHVSGIVALMLSANPDMAGPDIRQAIIDTATPMPTLAGKCVSSGLVNAGRAVAWAAAAPADTVSPAVVSTTPAEGAVGIDPAAAIIVRFSEPVRLNGPGGAISLLNGSLAQPASMTVSGSQLTVTPQSAMTPATAYALLIPAGAIADPAGNALAADFSLHFTTRHSAAQFVARLYQTCLGRSPDPSGLDSWTSELLNRRKTGADVAASFIFSDEFQSRQLAGPAFVQVLYRAFLDREPDPGGIAYWTSILERGVTRYFVFAGFVNSDEFRALSAAYGIDPGTAALTAPADRYPELTAFVARFYRLCLERPADDAGLNYWVDGLARQVSTGAAVADNFVSSTEFVNRAVSDELYVTIMYRAFFDREPDPGGLAYWTGRLRSGTARRTVLAGFVNSAEFMAICQRYGIASGAIR